jgi:hypothetical protein
MKKNPDNKAKNQDCDGTEEIDFILWKETLNKELPEFWESINSIDKKVIVQCLLSLWLFSFTIKGIMEYCLI